MIRVIVASLLMLMFGVLGVAARTSLKSAPQKPSVHEIVVSDNCRPATWKSVPRDVVKQAADLIRQYDTVSDQLAKLGTAGGDRVMVIRPEHASLASLGPLVTQPVYEGNWSEVREALQGMLSKRLSGLACKLQVLGVDMGRKASS
jgi:hypothetical protein